MAFAGAVLILVFTIVKTIGAEQIQNQLHSISLGSSLSPSTQPISWQSPSRRFQFGFYEQNDGYSVGIWFVVSHGITVVWTAKRDDPPVSSNASLTLTMGGQLVVRTGESKDKIIAQTSEPASFASMLDSGNFVLYNNRSHIIWSSFSFPTDTILEGQSLSAGSELFSNVSEFSTSTGRYHLKMQVDGNLVLYPTNTLDLSQDAYWSSGTYGRGKLHLYLNYSGTLLFLDNMSIKGILNNEDSSSNDNSIIYRATLEYNGILRLYSHYLVSNEGVYNTSVKWEKPEEFCLVKTFCGLNSYCTLYDDQPSCRCLPGTDFLDSDNMFDGCGRNFAEEKCTVKNRSTELYHITSMKRISWDDYPYFSEILHEEGDCGKSCLEDCNCDAALYNSKRYCTKHKLPLKYARRDQGETESSIAYFKIGIRNITSHNNSDSNTYPPERITSKKTIVLILVMTIGLITCSCGFLAISGVFIFRYRVVKFQWLLENGSMGLTEDLTLRSFSYNELKKATNGFKEGLGKGSFGSVYKGTLYKGEKLVAVKRLEKMANEGEREFRAEMHVIGRTHHKNLVRLIGYCAEDSKRLLVYEYMSNGSLADLIFRGVERSPDWNERVRIAIDVAKGILYLHDECEAPIIHCDIKPQNILIDEFRTAKISDFGLAKLLMPDQTKTLTIIRGTRGYMAPEWYKNAPTPISVKADVYSYGVVLLELICCRRNMEVDPSKPDEIVLIKWVYKCFIEGELKKLVRGQEVDKKTFESLVKLALWCVQDEPPLRPSMKSVVTMLEGITDVSIPPCPTSS